MAKMATFFPEVAAFNLKMCKDSVKVTIVENENQLESGIKELFHAINLKNSPLIGFDLKTRTIRLNNTASRHILFLCVQNRCLVILIHPSKTISTTLQSVLSCMSVCFVGNDLSEKVNILFDLCSSKASAATAMDAAASTSSMPYTLKSLATAVDVILLVARVFKKPELRNSKCLVQVGKTIGLGLDLKDVKDNEAGSGKDHPDWTDLCLSEKDMMIEMKEAYLCYKIADFCRKKTVHVQGQGRNKKFKVKWFPHVC